MTIESRHEAIQKLQEVRGGNVLLAYLTSCRAGFEAQMAEDAIPIIYDHLRALPTPVEERTIDLFIHSNGGLATVPWKLVTLLRQFCSQLNVLVPHRAYSAATLTALGADTVVMHPMGNLGPTDPSINGPYNPTSAINSQVTLPVSVEDVASYISMAKEDVGLKQEDALVRAFIALTEKVHPLALGSVKRTTSQGKMLGDKLLRRRNRQLAPAEIAEIMRKLGSELFAHGHPINAREAREDLGLDFVLDATRDEAEAMWNLYLEFDADLKQGTEFNVLREAILKSPLSVPTAGVPGMLVAPSQALVQLDPIFHAMVESDQRADAFTSECEVVILRDAMGNYQNGNPTFTRQSWVKIR